MIWLWRATALVSLLVAALGLFWFSQGVGLIVVDPILCGGGCEPVRAPSRTWQVVGGVTALVGVTLSAAAARRSRRGAGGDAAQPLRDS